MDNETLIALKASIKHWEKNVAAKRRIDASTVAKACALCCMFEISDGSCAGCPVRNVSGQGGCNGTPFWDASDAYDAWSRGLGTRDEWRKAAQAELDFLKSLLPVKS